MSATSELAVVFEPEVEAGRPRGLATAVLSRPSGRLGAGILAAVLGVAVLAPVIAPASPFDVAGPPLAPPSFAHPMGTDALGRDLFSGVAFGARTSLTVGALVGAVALVLGLAVGIAAGWSGGWVDATLTHLTELFQVLPRLFVAALVIALMGPGLDRLVLVLALTAWPVLARVVRAETRWLREREFVRAAEASGASPSRIVLVELLPNLLPSACVVLGLTIGQVLLLEAGLGFLGLGDPNYASWGSLAAQAQGFLRAAWWLPFFPGLAVALTVVGVNLVADAAVRPAGGRG